jgi:hypothetical protein
MSASDYEAGYNWAVMSYRSNVHAETVKREDGSIGVSIKLGRDEPGMIQSEITLMLSDDIIDKLVDARNTEL